MKSETIVFNVPGECRGKMRPKATVFGGHARVYTPNKQIEYENWVRQCFHTQHPDHKPFDGEVRVNICCYMAIPKSTSKKKAELMKAGEINPTKKPDTDNIAKSILDSLNTLAFKDDSQVVRLSVCKRYDQNPSVHIEMKGDYNDED